MRFELIPTTCKYLYKLVIIVFTLLIYSLWFVDHYFDYQMTKN